MSSVSTVLICTYPEYGQSNVNLAISYELALAGVNIHIASFPSLGTRISRLQELVNRHASRLSGKTAGSVTFHAIEGVMPNWEAARKCGITNANLPHPGGVNGAVESYAKTGHIIFAWGPEEYLAAIANVKEIITTTKPEVVGVDLLFFAARDACQLSNQKFVIISPNGLKDVAVDLQPYRAAWWKYPMISSGFPFPLKWWQIPLNIYLGIRFSIQSILSENIRQTTALRKSLGLEFPYGGRPGVTFICPALAEIDLPMTVIPDKMLLCGPIIMPFDPLEENDPELMKWLDNGPTVLVNLGSLALSNAKIAREMAGAFRILLEHHDKKGELKKIQVLWKAKADGEIQEAIDEVIGREIEEGRVKVVAWLEVEPVSVLQHPNVICTVHHGGANSFYEGVWSGVPHVVLPVWFDTYDYARRAEYLNIGIFGSTMSAPGVQAEELGNALVKITENNEEADKFRASAKHLREVCRTRGNGRELACAAILDEAGVRM